MITLPFIYVEQIIAIMLKKNNAYTSDEEFIKFIRNSTWVQTDVTKKAMHSKVNVLSKLMKWVGSRIKTR